MDGGGLALAALDGDRMSIAPLQLSWLENVVSGVLHYQEEIVDLGFHVAVVSRSFALRLYSAQRLKMREGIMDRQKLF